MFWYVHSFELLVWAVVVLQVVIFGRGHFAPAVLTRSDASEHD